MKRKLIALLMLTTLFMTAAEPVYYRDFGARGDGKTNDFAAIVKTHEFANQHNRPVKAEDDAVYFIGDTETTAVIQTDTDWGKAHFVIDDRLVTERFNKPLFSVQSRQLPFPVKNLPPPKSGQKVLGVKLPCRALVLLVDRNRRRYIRYGRNANAGSFQSDVVLADEEGRIDPETPFNWDYQTVSAAAAYPVDRDTLTIQGGIFQTLANARPGKHRYFARNIAIMRSNTVIKNLRHEVVESEGPDSWPYTGFISINRCTGVTVQDCAMSGRAIYGWPKPGSRRRFTTGTYDISAKSAVKIYFHNIRQINDIMDHKLWGIMATNFCKAVYLRGCRLSRFDAHQGVTNVVIRDCEMGHQGINAIGFGTFLVENTTNRGSNFINFREDYGSMWQGELIIRNCLWLPTWKYGRVISGRGNPEHDFGYPCGMPEKITIDGLTIKAGPAVIRCEFFAEFDHRKSTDPGPYPYTLTKVLKVRGLTFEGRKFLFSRNAALLKKMQILGDLPPNCIR